MAILVQNQSPNSTVFSIVRFPGSAKTVLSWESLYNLDISAFRSHVFVMNVTVIKKHSGTKIVLTSRFLFSQLRVHEILSKYIFILYPRLKDSQVKFRYIIDVLKIKGCSIKSFVFIPKQLAGCRRAIVFFMYRIITATLLFHQIEP